MNKLILTVGISNSGKTTWVEEGINDLYHYIEFETLSAPQRMKLFNKLRWLLKKRRELRNSNAVITEFKSVLWSEGKPYSKDSQKVFNDIILQECIDKKVDIHSSAVYYPRVVTLQDALGD